MKNLKKDLQTVNKELKELAKKTESLLKAVDKFEKPKAKPTKAKAVKKTPAKKVAVKKAAPKKPAPKKAAPATAADTVLAIIKKYKKGVNVSTLIEKTGFNKRKIYNNVKVLNKQGKIKSVRRGVYVKA
jgi:chaperonin GroES